jgi:hypothetical protein
MAHKVADFDVEAQLGGRVQGIEIRSNSPGGELMRLKGDCIDGKLLRTGSANSAGQAKRTKTTISFRSAGQPSVLDSKRSLSGRGAGYRTSQRLSLSRR